MPCFPMASTAQGREAARTGNNPEQDIQHLAYKAISAHMSQKVMVIDNADKLVFISNEAKEFLTFKNHHPSLVVYELVPQPLRAELKAQLFKVRRNRQSSESSSITNLRICISPQAFPI